MIGGSSLRVCALSAGLLAGLLAICPGVHAQPLADADEPPLTAHGVAGEILDIAVEACRRGDSAQALAMFRAIREQLNPPSGILRLIKDLESTGCVQHQLAAPSGLRIQFGGGYDSNVTQGISARELAIGTGPNVIELPLDASYLPQGSAFTQAAVDYGLVLPRSGVNVQASAAARKNASVAAFDLTTATVSASREFRFGGRILRGQVDLGDVSLGAHHYQRTRAAGLQWIWVNDWGSWLASANLSRIDYFTQPAQNSFVRDAGLLYERRFDAATAISGGASVLVDEATDGRPGGDRRGYQLQATAVLTRGGWRYRPQLSYTQWTSANVFAPGLIDVRRRNELWQAVIQAEKPLSSRNSLVLEWRGRWARDTVVLYAYKAQTFTTSFVHRF